MLRMMVVFSMSIKDLNDVADTTSSCLVMFKFGHVKYRYYYQHDVLYRVVYAIVDAE